MKKLLSLVLVLSLIMTATVPVHAASEKSVENKVEKLAKKYGFELVELPEGADTIELESVEELEDYFKALQKAEVAAKSSQAVEMIKVASPEMDALSTMATRASTYSDSYLWNWWNPFAAFDGVTLLCWSNIYAEYEYAFDNGDPYFVSCAKSDISSYLTGISITWWDQIGAIPTIKTTTIIDDTLQVKVSGRYVLGVSIGGFTIGASRNDTWTKLVKLVN